MTQDKDRNRNDTRVDNETNKVGHDDEEAIGNAGSVATGAAAGSLFGPLGTVVGDALGNEDEQPADNV